MGPSLTWNSFGYHVNLNGTKWVDTITRPIYSNFTGSGMRTGKYNANVLTARSSHSRITHLTKKQDFEYTPP